MEHVQPVHSQPGGLPPSMAMTQEERIWALELRRVVEQAEDVVPITDMEYAHHAIISRGNTQQALQRIQGLQQFKELYHVQDTPEEGVAMLQRFMEIQPGGLIYLDIYEDGGEGIVAFDAGGVFPSRAHSEAAWRIHILAYYYMHQAMQPNLHACREGIYVLMEGKDMGWDNFDMTFEQRLTEEFWMHYPLKNKRMKMYNTNSVINVAWSLLKPLIPREFRQATEMGCQIELEEKGPKLTLRDLYFSPSYDVAMHQLLERARNFLTLRYQNEQDFRL